MIRIRLPNAETYYDLQEKYLRMIVKYIMFDEKDILMGAQSCKKGKTKNTARKLKEAYPKLYNFLFEDIGIVKKENLRKLLLGPDICPDGFGGNSNITLRHYFEDIITQCQLPEGKKQRKNAIKICRGIFRYDNFIKSQQDAYELLRKLDVRVCPYCNRIYTVTLPSRKELKNDREFRTTRPTFDHFYCQDAFPYLALNLFNLIPSCHVCNINKGMSDSQIIYPYDEEFGEKAVIRLIPDLSEESYKIDEGVLNFLHGDSERFHIRFMGNEGISLIENAPLDYRLSGIESEEYRKRIENSIKLFRLEELYNEHRVEIKDILRNRYYFNEAYVQSAICPIIQQRMWQKMCNNQRNGITDFKVTENLEQKFVQDIAIEMLFLTYIRQEEWGERPLSKLTSDIINQVSDI